MQGARLAKALLDTEFNFTNEWMKVDWHSDIHATLKKRTSVCMADDFPEGHFRFMSESAFEGAALAKKQKEDTSIVASPSKKRCNGSNSALAKAQSPDAKAGKEKREVVVQPNDTTTSPAKVKSGRSVKEGTAGSGSGTAAGLSSAASAPEAAPARQEEVAGETGALEDKGKDEKEKDGAAEEDDDGSVAEDDEEEAEEEDAEVKDEEKDDLPAGSPTGGRTT